MITRLINEDMRSTITEYLRDSSDCHLPQAPDNRHRGGLDLEQTQTIRNHKINSITTMVEKQGTCIYL